jgi:hypothetical protein
MAQTCAALRMMSLRLAADLNGHRALWSPQDLTPTVASCDEDGRRFVGAFRVTR